MFTNDSRSFKEKLAVGNDKENLLVDVLNLSSVPAKLNNEDNVTDVDILLTKDDFYVDSKYLETPFFQAEFYTGIKPQNCLTLLQRHIMTYDRKEKMTGKKVWIACLVDYKNYGIYEYRFFPNSYLMTKIQNNQGLRNGKLHVDRNIGKTMYQFLHYIEELRKMKSK